MNNLLQLFIRNGGFITFLVLEAVSFYLVVGDPQHGEIFNHSYGLFAGKILNWQSGMNEYFHLKEEVEALRLENAQLRTQNLNARLIEIPYRDTAYQILFDTISGRELQHQRLLRPAYAFVPATVISNNISLNNNWLMINRGRSDGIEPNMGVVSADGIVGIVRHADQHFAAVMSVLHRQSRISCTIKNKHAFGSLVWEKNEPGYMTLRDVPVHIPVSQGDTILTSGYSNKFPGDHLVGYVAEDPKPEKGNQYFYKIKVKLTQDPVKFNEVYVVVNLYSSALDSLQNLTYEQQ